MNTAWTKRLQALVLSPGPAQLGPEPRSGGLAVAALEAELGSIFHAQPVPAPQRELVRALLLLWHDHLDASHTISQGIENRDGSLVHAIMHRREPDYWNSKYWWRRVGEHPCFGELGEQATALLEGGNQTSLSRRLVFGGRWNPDAFVDAFEAAADLAPDSPQIQILRAVQQIETQVTLQHFVGTAFRLEFALP